MTMLPVYLNHFHFRPADAITRHTAAQQYLKRRRNLAGSLGRTSMKTNGGNSMLSARIHASTDLDLDIVVVNQLGKFVSNDVFKYPAYIHAVRNTQVTGIGSRTGGHIGYTVKRSEEHTSELQ